jgi:hypothetical protein
VHLGHEVGHTLATCGLSTKSAYFGLWAVSMGATEGQDGGVRASEMLLDVLRATGQDGAAGGALMTSMALDVDASTVFASAFKV